MTNDGAPTTLSLIINRDGTINRPAQEAIQPQKLISIVVNPDIIEATALLGNGEAREALVTIRALKDGQNANHHFREVNLSGRQLSRTENLLAGIVPDLPGPSPTLQVQVCGVNTDISNIALVYELKKAGYTAGFNKAASCAGRTEPPSGLIHQILDEFPDFFD